MNTHFLVPPVPLFPQGLLPGAVQVVFKTPFFVSYERVGTFGDQGLADV